MCAPRNLNMEPDSISRFNSTSTSKTLVNSENDFASSILSPASLIDRKLSNSNPILQTADNKQWIDLDSISPKLLKELRRQYDTSNDDEKNPISKGAAKIKAWTRQTKLGFDIRLRRKVQDHDEVTDFRLYRDPSLEIDETTRALPELPGNAFCELPDTSIIPELPTSPEREQRENPVDYNLDEPLPRYVPMTENNSANTRPQLTIDPVELHHDTVGHDRSPSSSSIVATPTDGLPLEKPEDNYTDAKAPSPKTSEGPSYENSQASEATFNQARQQMKEEVISLLNTLKEELSKQNSSDPANRKDLEGLRIADMVQYETETDAEPPSPSQRKIKQTSPWPGAKPKRLNTGRRVQSKIKYGDAKDDQDTLARRQTLPKRIPPSAGAENVWSAVLTAQSKILGAEHPLTFQAKHAQSLSRVRQHRNCPPSFLDALCKSETVAMQTLGKIHPLVKAFCADLQTLESLIVNQQSPRSNEAKGNESDSSWSSDIDEMSISVPEISEGSSRPPKLPAGTVTPLEVVIKKTDTETSFPKGSRRPPKLPEPEVVIEKTDAETSFPNDKVKQSTGQVEVPHQIDSLWDTWRSPHQPKHGALALSSLVMGAVIDHLKHVISWLERKYGPEPAVETGKVRVRWTCSCGEQLYDDFVERRRGAARELEAYLNRPSRPRTRGGDTPSSPSSSSGSNSSNGSLNSSIGGSMSSQTSWSSYSQASQRSFSGGGKRTDTTSSLPQYTPFAPLSEPPWLLTCANEDRFVPKVAHLDMSPHKITSDKDFAKALREHYFDINRKWWKQLKLRSLTTIEFVQFECHQNRFADIRKCPDMPPHNKDDYVFEAGELMPPVGSQYLLHLFKHPEDYDGELITYLRAPKKTGRLSIGVGWGFNLVEGFMADRVWLLINAFFGFASLVFGTAWALERNDIQGAFGVAQWICMFAVFVGGWFQAFLG